MFARRPVSHDALHCLMLLQRTVWRGERMGRVGERERGRGGKRGREGGEGEREGREKGRREE